MMIRRMPLEVLRELADPLGQESDLDFGRAGIQIMELVAADDFRLLFLRKGHPKSSPNAGTSGAPRSSTGGALNLPLKLRKGT
jgi:hypothetical protein